MTRRTHGARGRRYEPTPIYQLAERLKRQGVKLHQIPGPWRPARHTLRRPGRNAPVRTKKAAGVCAGRFGYRNVADQKLILMPTCADQRDSAATSRSSSTGVVAWPEVSLKNCETS